LQATNDATKALGNFRRLFYDSHLYVVAFGFSSLAIINLITLVAGPKKILLALNANPLGILLSSLVFDSWGTVFGLLGLILLFTPVLVGTRKSFRKSLAVFLLLDSIGTGVAAALIWNYYFKLSGQIPYGASSIAISGQAIIFTMAIFGLIQLRLDGNWVSTKDPYWRKSLAVIYVTLAATTLWFVLSLEPIFVPTIEYNWRVHEIGFLLATFSSIAYSVVALSREKSTLE
jgi:hypothetical protein